MAKQPVLANGGSRFVQDARLKKSSSQNFRLDPASDVPSDDALHPHDLYISRIAGCLKHWEHPDWLDVGCGWHLDWPWELEREKRLLAGARIVGIDLDRVAIARHRTIVNRTVAAVETLPFADGAFDIVTANVVVEHLKYPSIAFAEIFRVLRRDGCFIFRTPSAHSYFVRVARHLPQSSKVWLATRVIQKRQPEDVYPAHYRANTPEIVQEICEMVGFRRVEITVTKVQGILSRIPALVRMERAVASMLGITDGNLVVKVFK